MDEGEQKFVIKYFPIKGWDNKTITAELQTTFHDSDLPSSTVKRWIRKFKNCALFCDDDSRSGWPISILGWVLQKFLDRYPFLSTSLISKHFCISLSTVKEILRLELRLKKFSRRWIRHFLSDGRKKVRVDASRKLLSLLGIHAEHNFKGIATGDEF
jgi:transposase